MTGVYGIHMRPLTVFLSLQCGVSYVSGVRTPLPLHFSPASALRTSSFGPLASLLRAFSLLTTFRRSCMAQNYASLVGLRGTCRSN